MTFILSDRHDEFLKLERSIREVHDLFVELGALVTQQGDLVNNIAYNVEQAESKVEKGRKQLSDAERHQRSARRKKLICFTILSCVIIIVVLVILGEFGVFSSSEPSPERVQPTTTPPLSSKNPSIDPTIAPTSIEPTIVPPVT